jgi:hypothetical protein
MIEVTKNNLSHYLLSINNRQIILAEDEAKTLYYALFGALAEEVPPVETPAASTHPDPALLLAQRIASISAETGLKPRIVFNIVNHAYWEEKEALEAAAPQENPTDDSAAQLLRIAQELGPHDNAALVTIASRILSKEIY